MATNILAPLPVDFFLKKEVSPFNQTFIVVTRSNRCSYTNDLQCNQIQT